VPAASLRDGITTAPGRADGSLVRRRVSCDHCVYVKIHDSLTMQIGPALIALRAIT